MDLVTLLGRDQWLLPHISSIASSCHDAPVVHAPDWLVYRRSGLISRQFAANVGDTGFPDGMQAFAGVLETLF